MTDSQIKIELELELKESGTATDLLWFLCHTEETQVVSTPTTLYVTPLPNQADITLGAWIYGVRGAHLHEKLITRLGWLYVNITRNAQPSEAPPSHVASILAESPGHQYDAHPVIGHIYMKWDDKSYSISDVTFDRTALTKASQTACESYHEHSADYSDDTQGIQWISPCVAVPGVSFPGIPYGLVIDRYKQVLEISPGWVEYMTKTVIPSTSALNESTHPLATLSHMLLIPCLSFPYRPDLTMFGTQTQILDQWCNPFHSPVPSRTPTDCEDTSLLVTALWHEMRAHPQFAKLASDYTLYFLITELISHSLSTERHTAYQLHAMCVLLDSAYTGKPSDQPFKEPLVLETTDYMNPIASEDKRVEDPEVTEKLDRVLKNSTNVLYCRRISADVFDSVRPHYRRIISMVKVNPEGMSHEIIPFDTRNGRPNRANFTDLISYQPIDMQEIVYYNDNREYRECIHALSIITPPADPITPPAVSEFESIKPAGPSTLLINKHDADLEPGDEVRHTSQVIQITGPPTYTSIVVRDYTVQKSA